MNTQLFTTAHKNNGEVCAEMKILVFLET